MASQKPKPRIQLVLDFDGTITMEDTTAVIGARCLAKARELAPKGLSPGQLPNGMSYYSDLYSQQYKDWKDSTASTPAKRTTIDEELSFLSQSRQVELDSFLRVRSAVLGVPGGVDNFERDVDLRNEFMMAAGREAVRSGDVKIRDLDALKSLIAKVGDGRNQWGIVSVSWSRRFILGALLEGGVINEGNEHDFANNINANELLAPLSATGQDWANVICSAIDKRNAIRQLLAYWNVDSKVENGVASTIYVGDSSTDIGCLLDASTGFYICENSSSNSVVQTLDGLGVRCAPLGELGDILEAQTKDKHRATIYLIKGFEELDGWLSRSF